MPEEKERYNISVMLEPSIMREWRIYVMDNYEGRALGVATGDAIKYYLENHKKE